MTLVDVPEYERPLCPNIGWPGNKFHELRNQLHDAIYDVMPKDADGEVDDHDGEILRAHAHGTVSERMSLFQIAVVTGRTRQEVVEAFYFKCGLCGLILPATRREQR